MKFIKFFILVLFLLNPLSTKALFCDYTELAILKSKATNINISYFPEFDSEEKLTFKIYFSNLREDLVLIDLFNNKKYEYETGELVIENKNPGSTYNFRIYTEKTFCQNKILREVSIKLPDYNKHYNSEICLKNPSNSLCEKWIKTVESETRFIELVNNSMQNEDTNDSKKEEFDFYDNWYQYYLYLVYSTIFVFLSMVFLIYKERRKDFDLDV